MNDLSSYSNILCKSSHTNSHRFSLPPFLLACPSSFPSPPPRLPQVQLRRSWLEYPEGDTDLYQWCGGSKFCSGPLEALLTLEDAGEAVEVSEAKQVIGGDVGKKSSISRLNTQHHNCSSR